MLSSQQSAEAESREQRAERDERQEHTLKVTFILGSELIERVSNEGLWPTKKVGGAVVEK